MATTTKPTGLTAKWSMLGTGSVSQDAQQSLSGTAEIFTESSSQFEKPNNAFSWFLQLTFLPLVFCKNAATETRKQKKLC